MQTLEYLMWVQIWEICGNKETRDMKEEKFPRHTRRYPWESTKECVEVWENVVKRYNQ